MDCNYWPHHHHHHEHWPIDADTFSCYMGLNVHSKDEINNIVKVSNNKAEYFARLSKKQADKAKESADLAQYYSEQNTNLTQADLLQLRKTLELQISTKQDAGNYAKMTDLPTKVSDLVNDSDFVTETEMDLAINEVKLPDENGSTGKFLYTKNGNISWKNISTYAMFDIKVSDHILSEEESKGFALQGTYVYKESATGRYGYPDFYNKCIAEKTAGTATQTTLGSSTITTYNNANGHIFYDIADKAVVDEYFSTNGVAWYYGIDMANERIFLPRNNKFIQCTTDTSQVNEFNEAGLPNITGNAGGEGICNWSSGGAITMTNNNALGSGHTSNAKSQNINFDASRSSSIYGKSNTVQPASVNHLLYIVVGNTEETQAITNVTEITTSENDTIPLFTGMYFDFKPNNPSWLKAGEQQNSAGIYTSCYNTLVNCLTATNNIYGLKVIATADMVEGTDYSEYWKVNQDEMYFITPTVGAISGKEGSQLYFKVANAVQNLELLDAGEILESCATKSMVDGQWVSKRITIASEVNNPLNTDLVYDLSSYLPNDGYQYEVLFTGYMHSGTTKHDKVLVMLTTDLISHRSFLGLSTTRVDGSSADTGGSVILPIGTARKLSVSADSTNTGNFTLYTNAYRRIGTNQ